jgi:hypothetical protein
MTPAEDETLWRNRFITLQMTRIGATMVVMLGLAIWQSDLIVEGGSILGMPIALIALFVSFWGPKYLARRWKTPPNP